MVDLNEIFLKAKELEDQMNEESHFGALYVLPKKKIEPTQNRCLGCFFEICRCVAGSFMDGPYECSYS